MFKEVYIGSCDEEELKEELKNITEAQKRLTTEVKFSTVSNGSDRFTVNILKTDELDEDDDQDTKQTNETQEQINNNATVAINDDHQAKVSESSTDSLEDSGSQSSFRKLKVNLFFFC